MLQILVLTHALGTASIVAEATIPSTPQARSPSLPWVYDWNKFPCAWFGGNGTDFESAAQIAEIGRYSLAIFGWQHLVLAANWTAVVYTQLTQAAILKSAHPSMPVFVYTGFANADAYNWATRPLMLLAKDPAYSQMFLQAADGPLYSYSGCQQMGLGHHVTLPCTAYFWNFANASARAFFIDHIVTPLTKAPMIDGIFFDDFSTSYNIIAGPPWGRNVVNIPNCSRSGGEGCEALIEGTLTLARETAKLLNAHGKVPIFGDVDMFSNWNSVPIFAAEQRFVDALDGLKYVRYYEGAQADANAMKPGGLFDTS